MNINISPELAQTIALSLWRLSYDKEYKEFNRAVHNSSSPAPNKVKREENGRFAPKYRVYKEFVYASENSKTIKNRVIGDVQIAPDYIIGRDVKDGKTKQFRKDRIIGRVKTVKKKI